jgi:nucleoside-triphosphatase THEP1
LLTLPALDASSARRGLELLDLESGQQRPLASVDGDLGGPGIGSYHFDPATLRWGEGILVAAPGRRCDLLVVDEIGRLELEQDSGFRRILTVLASNPFPRSLLVVRDTLLETFRLRLPQLEFTVFEATPGNRGLLPAEVLHFLFATWPW